MFRVMQIGGLHKNRWIFSLKLHVLYFRAQQLRSAYNSLPKELLQMKETGVSSIGLLS